MEEQLRYEYPEIDQLVMEFQDGDQYAAEELILTFNPFMKKYIKIITGLNVDLSDKDTRRFLSLYIKEPHIRKALINRHTSSEARSAAFVAANILSSVCKNMPYEDLSQEMTCILLLVAKRYKRKGVKVNFCGYLYNVFRYEVYRSITKFTSDPSVYLHDFKCTYFDEANEIEEDIFENHPELFIYEPMMILDDELGNSWVKGLTCGEVFESLSPMERLVLKSKYDEEISDIDIAEKIGVHRNTVRHIRERAISKLEIAKKELMI